MSTQWTAPGATGPGEPSPSSPPSEDRIGQAYGADARAPHQAAPSGAAPDGPAPTGPRRELVQSIPLFPLRPLGLGEVLGAAVRIYRLRTRTVLGVAAAVYGVAFVVLTLATGASLVPMMGDMQSMMENPEATAELTGLSTVRDLVLMVLSSAVTVIVTMVSTALVTVALTRVALGEAVGRSVSSEEMWTTMRRRGPAAIGVSLLIGVLSIVAFVLAFGLGMLPLLVVQEASWLTIVPMILGVVLALLAMLWIWVRTVLAIPALVLEDIGVFSALRRSLVLTRGRRLWRVLGTSLLLYLLYTVAVQIIAGVFSTIATILYLAILLATSFEGFVLAMVLMTILMMVGSYAATFLLAPFLSAGFVSIYADARMRHEAWDVELTRQAREAWAADGVR